MEARCLAVLIVIAAYAFVAQGKSAAQAPGVGALADGTYDWDQILEAGRAGNLDLNTNGDVVRTGTKPEAKKPAAKKAAVKPATPEQVQAKWLEALEFAKKEAMMAGAPAPSAVMPSSMAPMTAPSAQSSPDERAAIPQIKLAGNAESGPSNEAPAGFKTREGWPLSWLQKSRAEKPATSG